jgi:hypothetical protein
MKRTNSISTLLFLLLIVYCIVLHPEIIFSISAKTYYLGVLVGVLIIIFVNIWENNIKHKN